MAERLATGTSGLYVVDLEGVALRRLAGGFSMPEEVPIPQMAGPEIPAGHLEELERSFAARGLGTVVPLWLRHRAIAVFLVEGTSPRELEEFAARAAVALELSLRYSDRVARARHRQRATPGAELQQLLLPPRIAGFRGAEVAASVLPAYDVGGDWFEHSATYQGAWLAVADAAGKGPRRIRRLALTVAALRAARQGNGSLADAAILMDRAIVGFGDSSMFVTALLARWEYSTRTLEWLTFGHPKPCRLAADRRLRGAPWHRLPATGTARRSATRTDADCPDAGDRVVFYSDGVIERRCAEGRLGVEALYRHIAATTEPSAASLLTHVLSHVTGLHETPLDDDATVMVLAVLGDRTHEPSASPPREAAPVSHPT